MVRTIYKKDSSGKIRFLEISAKEDTVIQTSGVVGTDNPVTNISQCEPKNVGKVNSTTAEEQAILEAVSKLTEKMRLGYFETMEEAEAKGGSSFLLPMLAKDYKKTNFILCILWSKRCYCEGSGRMVFNYFRRTIAIYK